MNRLKDKRYTLCMKKHALKIIEMEKTMRTAGVAFDKLNVAYTKERHKCTLARGNNKI